MASVLAGLKQTKLRLPTPPRHVDQRNEAELIELDAVWSDIPLHRVRVA